MKATALLCALAAGVLLFPSIAMADDPKDPLFSHSAEARARDKAIIRRLNQDELARVRERDARYAEGRRAYRNQAAGNERYDRAMDDCQRQRAENERRRDEWRHAVARCDAGDYRYCD